MRIERQGANGYAEKTFPFGFGVAILFYPFLGRSRLLLLFIYARERNPALGVFRPFIRRRGVRFTKRVRGVVR